MAFFDGVSGRVYFRSWELAQPKAGVVLLHGLRQHSGQYNRFARKLNAVGIEVWALDHVGHGMSEGTLGEPGPIADLADNALQLCRIAKEQRTDQPQVLMGHSLGAGTAILVLLENPDRFAGVMLCGAPLAASTSESPRRPARGSEGSGATRARASADVRSRLVAERSASAVPILAVHGVDDRITPIDGVREWARQIPRVELREFANAGHDLLHERVHGEVTGVITQFILGSIPGTKPVAPL